MTIDMYPFRGIFSFFQRRTNYPSAQLACCQCLGPGLHRSRIQRVMQQLQRSSASFSITNKIREINRNNRDHILASYDTFMLDLDGTLYDKDHVNAIPGIPQAIAKLQSMNKKLIYVTNNSMRSNSEYVEKFKNFGFDAEEDDVFGVANAAALYLKDIAKITGKVYVVGGEGMAKELEKFGLDYFGVGPDPDPPSWNPNDLLKMEFKDNVQAVLVGFDEHFHYNKIYKAVSYLTDQNCLFVATNVVETALLLTENRLQPTTGSLIQCMVAATKREPLVVGKPGLLLLDCIKKKHPGVDLSRTVFVGDGLKSDIAFANRVGMDSILVLTGAGTLDKIDCSEVAPTFVMETFALFGL